MLNTSSNRERGANVVYCREAGAGLDAGFQALLQRYETLGGNLFYGFYETGDPRNYKGPLIWSEGDCAFRFAYELEEEFPTLVHLEMPIGRTFFADFDKERDKRQFMRTPDPERG